MTRPAVLRHRYVPPTPVRMTGKDGSVSLRHIDDILAANAKLSGDGKRERRRDRRR